MTATIVYLRPRGISILTDGAQQGPDGKTAAVRQKVGIAAHQSAAYVARGPDLFSGLLAVLVGQAQGRFDDLAAAFPSLCQQAHGAMLASIEAGTAVVGDPNLCDAILVGHSPRHGYCGWVVSSYPEDGREAFRAFPLEGDPLAFASPMDDRIAGRLRASGVDLFDPAAEADTHGLEVMRAMRATGFVGSFCQMTNIMESGIFTTILERWDDAPGSVRAVHSFHIAGA